MTKSRRNFQTIKRVVIKVGTSTLSYKNGRLNFRRIRNLSSALHTLRTQGFQVLLVSSGAVGVGAGRMGLTEKPRQTAQKQALAAVGQAQLMKIYQKFFDQYRQPVAQVLLTKDVMTIDYRHRNARASLFKLLEMGIIPIINENDTVVTDEIEFGDNDTLSAMVAALIDADLLIMLTDINGLYSADPNLDQTAVIIPSVPRITQQLAALASGSAGSFGTGGMATKISAAGITVKAGIHTIIANGNDPHVIFDVLAGKPVGTHFVAQKKAKQERLNQ